MNNSLDLVYYRLNPILKEIIPHEINIGSTFNRIFTITFFIEGMNLCYYDEVIYIPWEEPFCFYEWDNGWDMQIETSWITLNKKHYNMLLAYPAQLFIPLEPEEITAFEFGLI